jgi:hypothetical protein
MADKNVKIVAEIEVKSGDSGKKVEDFKKVRREKKSKEDEWLIDNLYPLRMKNNCKKMLKY